MTENSVDLATRGTALAFSTRWDEQQTGYIRHRQERFATIARVVGRVTRNSRAPRILDLAGGTGSLGRTILEVIPHASLVIADKDPVLTRIAENISLDDDRVSVVRIDLDSTDWLGDPIISSAPFDAIVSSTALHWLTPQALVGTYWALPGLLSEDGIFLNGDHLSYDSITHPTLAEVAAADDAEVQAAAFGGSTQTWDQWWAEVSAHPDYVAAAEERATVWGASLTTAPPRVSAEFHLSTLRSAGFRETGILWRYLDDVVVYGAK